MNAHDRTMTTMTSREFNQDTAGAKRAARRGPVLITDRGKPSYVLLTKEEYDSLERERDAAHAVRKPTSGLDAPAAPRKSLVDILADTRPEADFDFQFPEFKGRFKGVDFE